MPIFNLNQYGEIVSDCSEYTKYLRELESMPQITQATVYLFVLKILG